MLPHSLQDSKTLLISDRGDSKNYPENSLQAFLSALDHGAQGIKIDVQLTQDGVIIVSRDTELKKYGLLGGRFLDFEWHQIQKLDAGSWKSPRFFDYKLLRLQDILEEFGHTKKIFLEFCESENEAIEKLLAALISREISNFQLEENIALLSSRPAILQQAYLRNNQLGLYLKTHQTDSLESFPFLSGVAVPSREYLDEQLIEKAKLKNLELAAWSSSSEKKNEDLFAEVDYLFIDDMESFETVKASSASHV